MMQYRTSDGSPCWRSLWQAIGALLVALVIYLSLTPDPIALPGPSGDKGGHVLAYATLMFWFAQLDAGLRRRIGWATAFIAMGITLEFVQRAIGYRSFEFFDMLAGALGVGAGWLAAPPRLPNLLRFVEARVPALLDRTTPSRGR
jgi:hypothetical protein